MAIVEHLIASRNLSIGTRGAAQPTRAARSLEPGPALSPLRSIADLQRLPLPSRAWTGQSRDVYFGEQAYSSYRDAVIPALEGKGCAAATDLHERMMRQTRVIDEAGFHRGMRALVSATNRFVAGDPYLLLYQDRRSFGDQSRQPFFGPRRSEYFVFELMRHKGLASFPVRRVSTQELSRFTYEGSALQHTLQQYPDMKLVVLDDAAYSGMQLRDKVSALLARPEIAPERVMVGLVGMTGVALQRLLDVGAVHNYASVHIPCLGHHFNQADITYLGDAHNPMCGVPQELQLTFPYFKLQDQYPGVYSPMMALAMRNFTPLPVPFAEDGPIVYSPDYLALLRAAGLQPMSEADLLYGVVQERLRQWAPESLDAFTAHVTSGRWALDPARHEDVLPAPGESVAVTVSESGVARVVQSGLDF